MVRPELFLPDRFYKGSDFSRLIFFQSSPIELRPCKSIYLRGFDDDLFVESMVKKKSAQTQKIDDTTSDAKSHAGANLGADAKLHADAKLSVGDAAHESLHSYQLKPSTDVSNLPPIRGIDFDQTVTMDSFVESLAATGLQASELSHAIEVARMMVREKCTIFLSFTSNVISSGLREVITWLVKHQKVGVLSTSAGGVEEDAIKAFSPFRLGTFFANGETLFDAGIGRIGNIYTTATHYSYFEQFMQTVFDALLAEQKELGRPSTPTDVARMIAIQLEKNPSYDHNTSYLYWAWKNNIPVFCPGIVDGSIGDLIYFYKHAHPDFVIDVARDNQKIIDIVLNAKKTAGIVLGGGISKHYILNANIFREGFDYTVYISTAQSYDGSDSGGSPDEAVSWAKIKIHTPRVKVYSDVSLAFPLLVYGAFVKDSKK